MSPKQGKRKQSFLENFESYNRITSIPVVNKSWNIAENVYGKIKNTNKMVSWTLDQAENSIQLVVDTATPAAYLFQKPISSIDRMICKSLDIAEQRVPSINLPPEMIYSNTKQYISDVGGQIVRPVLKRADSVKQIGNTVLASKYTNYAADKLDGALNVADTYVDKYLPAEKYDDQSVDEPDNPVEGPTGKAFHTLYHVDRFSRKLKRRLTKRTIEEAIAIKEQSAEAVHVLIYVAELIAKDPKLAFQKGKELWASLSKDEPENQARPDNLEQLVVMLVRETSRRVVHLINFTTGAVAKVPRYVSNKASFGTQQCLNVADNTLKMVHLDGVKEAVVKVVNVQVHTVQILLKQLNIIATDILEQLAMRLNSDKQKAALTIPTIQVDSKAVHNKTKHKNREQHHSSHVNNSSTNGVDSNSYES